LVGDALTILPGKPSLGRHFTQVVDFGIQGGDHALGIANCPGSLEGGKTRLNHLLPNDLINQQEQKEYREQGEDQLAA
jgi:hypothetical protein